jgi:DNA invertase Pin-like site-specific DNA recombinase/PBP1b-binding outer membrane lipoprotein LpoB
MKTAVIYARYSSDSQTEQSIEGQLRVCQQFAKNNDILIVDTYIDRAMTGTNDARPDFQRMIKDSNKRQWNYVIVYKLDRFSRNKYETTIHKHTLKENGVKVLSAMENIPDTPEGIILESLLEGMNQYYSAELSQKVHRGLNESYLKGNFTGGSQLYGYDVVDKKNIINPDEAEIVREIFSKFANGYTGKSIADNLIARGIRTKKGRYLDEKKVYKIIANTKYFGIVEHNGTVYTNIYPAIIDENTWQSVQMIRNTNKHKPGTKKQKFGFLLSSKLICGVCRSFMVGNSGNNKNGEKYTYYTCLSRNRRKQDCDLRNVQQKWIEDLVISISFKLLKENNGLEDLINDIYKKHQTENKEAVLIKSLEKRREDALKASNNIIAAIEQGIITEQTKDRLKELEAEIAQYDFDIEQARQRNYSYLTTEKIREYFNKVISGDIEALKTREKIVKYLIREIILYNDYLVITYNFSDKDITKKTIPDDIDEVEKEIKETFKATNNGLLCSDNQCNSPP